MKDINLNNTSDSNTPNVDISENTMDKENEIKINETTSNKNGEYVEVTEEATGPSSDVLNGNDETDDVNMVDSDVTKPGIGISEQKQDASVVLKHNYNEEQWSTLNPCGKKIYDIRLLKDIKSDPLSKIKPNFPLLETYNLLRILTGIKLAPIRLSPIWNKGSETKSQIPAPIKKMYSLLENAQLDPATLRTPSDGAGATSIPLKSLPPTSKPKVPETTETSPPEPLPQEGLPENLRKSLKQFIDLAILNLNDNELVEEVKLLGSQYQAAVVTDILNIALEKNAKVIDIMAKSLVRLTDLGIVSGENLMLGMADIFEIGPDLYIDIPMLYTYLAKFIVPHIEKKNVTFNDILKPAESLVSAGHGHILLRAIISELKDSMGPTFARNRWQESGLELKQWMDADMVPNWISNNNFEFLEGSDNNASTDEKKPMSPSDMHSKLIQLMKTEESCDCIRGWVKDNIGQSIGEPWFLRGLTQAICEHAILATDGATRLNIERMKKYSPLIGEYADSQVEREFACLFGIQQLIHRLEHPQGLLLDIFQYLDEHYIISVDGFIAWESS